MRTPEYEDTLDAAAHRPGNQPVLRPYATMSDREHRGWELYRLYVSDGKNCNQPSDDVAVWFGGREGRIVERSLRNCRGKHIILYRCSCPDFKKVGRIDCKHIFAERLRREEIRVIEEPSTRKEAPSKVAVRGPVRHRTAANGQSVRTTQRAARVDMLTRTQELMVWLFDAYTRSHRNAIAQSTPNSINAGRTMTPDVVRAHALISKVVEGCSADSMVSIYQELIETGKLRLKRPPHQNTLSNWVNDERLTPVLMECLRLTAMPFRQREIGAAVDSSKVSQLRNAHARWVDYEGDKRPTAHWMKCHAIVGLETLVVMAVRFSDSIGITSHDKHFLIPLVDDALRVFSLQYVLADKAYLASDNLSWLWEHGIRAVIQVKKNWYRAERRDYSEAIKALVHWFDENNNREFHKVYRLRPKVECLFSLLKRLAGEHVWSRGRHHKGATSTLKPCAAWINETLCKFIYLNLRATVTLEHETSVRIDYRVQSRCFPPPDEPLLSDGTTG